MNQLATSSPVSRLSLEDLYCLTLSFVSTLKMTPLLVRTLPQCHDNIYKYILTTHLSDSDVLPPTKRPRVFFPNLLLEKNCF